MAGTALLGCALVLTGCTPHTPPVEPGSSSFSSETPASPVEQVEYLDCADIDASVVSDRLGVAGRFEYTEGVVVGDSGARELGYCLFMDEATNLYVLEYWLGRGVQDLAHWLATDPQFAPDPTGTQQITFEPVESTADEALIQRTVLQWKGEELEHVSLWARFGDRVVSIAESDFGQVRLSESDLLPLLAAYRP